MLSIKEIFYYVQAAAHVNIPDQDELQNEVNDYQERFDAAEQGIFINPMYRTHPFDKTSTQGKIYCDTLGNGLENAKARLNIFYPSSTTGTNPEKGHATSKNIMNHDPF